MTSFGVEPSVGPELEKYLVSMNLPSRAQMVGMAERIQSIEGQLNEIKTMLQQMQRASGNIPNDYTGAPRPPRTKRPPSSGGEPK